MSVGLGQAGGVTMCCRGNGTYAFGYAALACMGCTASSSFATTVMGYQAGCRFLHNVCYSVILGAGSWSSGSGRQCCFNNNVSIGYAIGNNATACISYGNLNVLIGNYVGRTQKSYNFETAIGYKAGCCFCSNWGRVAVGHEANACGRANTGNVSIGKSAGCCGWWTYSATNVGYQAQARGGYACYSVSVGGGAQCSSYVARYSTAIGDCALWCNYYGYYNTAIGRQAGKCVGSYGWSQGCGMTFVGFCAGVCANSSSYPIRSGYNGTYIGNCTRSGQSNSCTPYYETVIGHNTVGNGNYSVTVGGSYTTQTCFCGGTINKGSGSFRIVHPNPEKKNKWLFHSFVESPTAGDNIYRWSVNVSGGSCVMELPDYYNDLNENSMAWVKPVDHFGSAYAEVDEGQKNLLICSDKDGCYNILLIGTRCDMRAKEGWLGIEREK